MRALEFPDPPLATGRLALREWRAGDLPAIVAACRDPLIARFTTVPWPYSAADGRAFLAAQAQRRAAGAGIEFAIADPSDGRAVGAIALSAISDQHRRATIGYWIAPAARGRGLATAALGLLCAWAFETLGLRRLELTIDPDNAASHAVAIRCGFRREGLMRSHWVTLGGRRDSVVYGLLPEDRAG